MSVNRWTSTDISVTPDLNVPRDDHSRLIAAHGCLISVEPAVGPATEISPPASLAAGRTLSSAPIYLLDRHRVDRERQPAQGFDSSTRAQRGGSLHLGSMCISCRFTSRSYPLCKQYFSPQQYATPSTGYIPCGITPTRLFRRSSQFG
jgi:hypothetical protein